MCLAPRSISSIPPSFVAKDLGNTNGVYFNFLLEMGTFFFPATLIRDLLWHGMVRILALVLYSHPCCRLYAVPDIKLKPNTIRYSAANVPLSTSGLFFNYSIFTVHERKGV